MILFWSLLTLSVSPLSARLIPGLSSFDFFVFLFFFGAEIPTSNSLEGEGVRGLRQFPFGIHVFF